MKFIKYLAGFALFLTVGAPHAAGMLGVSNYAATKVVDAIFAGASIWTVLGLIAAGAGALAVAMAGIKTVAKKFGRKAAIAW